MNLCRCEFTAAADFVHHAEMGFTHDEILRGLPAAVAPFTIEKIGAREYVLRYKNRSVRLTMQPETTRPIANFHIPMTVAKLEFFNFTQSDHNEFMQRYKRYLHKGGG